MIDPNYFQWCTMFLKQQDFCLYIESKKTELGFDTYLETVIWYIENESDQDFEHVAKNLNRKIIESIAVEANNRNMLKENNDLVEL
jgi:hypothetical protein